MIGLVKFFQKRPSDNSIKIARIIFGIILSASLYYNLIYLGKNIDNTFFDFYIFFEISKGFTLDESQILIVKYFFSALGLVPIFMGITNLCLTKKKYMRLIQIAFAFVLFYISAIIEESPKLDIDTLIGFMGIFPLFAGITGKCITSKCLKYGEKITKIRV